MNNMCKVRSWRKADRLDSYKVRFERRTEVVICHDRRDAGLTLACDNQRGTSHPKVYIGFERRILSFTPHSVYCNI